MAISTNPKPTIYRNLYENMGPGTNYYIIIFQSLEVAGITSMIIIFVWLIDGSTNVALFTL